MCEHAHVLKFAAGERTITFEDPSVDSDHGWRLKKKSVDSPELERDDHEAYAHCLTLREKEVLTLLADGQSDREIAGRLFISPKTVEKHVCRARVKLEASSRTAAVARAIRLQLI